MRPTGAMHIGHYHGALKNWVKLQHEMETYHFVADWHALTTHYEDPSVLATSVWEMVIDWLAAGLDPNHATIFLQSRVAEHGELFTLLAMGTPLAWLERMPTYKDQIEKLKDKDLSTYGFLGYPLLQAADIMLYGAQYVPVGADQVPHIEMTREVARRFNHLYGVVPDFEPKLKAALKLLPGPMRAELQSLRADWESLGKTDSRDKAHALVDTAPERVSAADRELLHIWLQGSRKTILVEAGALLTETPKLPGVDGEKMSKSYNNAIAMREKPEVLRDKVRTMKTDPARARRTDAGNPDNCPVFDYHRIYTDAKTQAWAAAGCKSAGIGCLECKAPVAEAMIAEQAPWHERAEPYLKNPKLVREIVADGSARAQRVARETMRDVRTAMGLAYE
jgi:tryptophanyl-tRNA synthetase